MPDWIEFYSLLLEWGKVEEILGEFITAALICAILFALLQCFVGYRIRKIWTAIEGLLVFGGAAAGIAVYNGLQTGVVIAVAAGAGLVGGLLGYFLWIVGGFLRVLVFLYAVVGIIFASKDMLVLGIIIGLAAGLIGGILQVAFNRPFMIGYTAIAGGTITAYCLSKLIPEITEPWFLLLIIGGVLALLGILVQVLIERVSAKGSKATAEEMPIAGGGAENPLAAGSAAWAENPVPAGSAAQDGENVLDDETKIYTFGHSAVDANIAASREDAPSAGVAGMPMPDTNASAAGQTAAQALEQTSPQEAAQPPKSFCPKCGAEYKPGAKFCMKCGQNLQNL